jgi:hypothetical protein
MTTISVVKLTTLSCLFLSAAAVKNLPAKTTLVSTIEELATANTQAAPGDTIALKDGTYRISSYGIAVRSAGLTFKSQSGIRDNVVVSGAGMTGDIEYGFWVDANRVTIRDLTIQNVYYHCIQTNVNRDSLRVINCVLRDAREQLLKVPYSSSVSDPSEGGLVEGCLFEFSAGIASQYYTGGIDCHFAKNWIVKNNVFKGIRSPEDQVAEHAVHFWNNSEGTLVENNSIINCDRGIGLGLGDSPHKGGIIRNNMIYHAKLSGVDNADVGIALETCPDAKVYHNTVFFDNDYPNAIEYRFAATKNVFIVNNLTNKTIALRDGASANVSNNITNAQASWFASPATGDLHINSNALNAIDHGTDFDSLMSDIDGEPRYSGTIDIGADEYFASRVLWFSPKKGDPFGLTGTGARRSISFFNLSGRKIRSLSENIMSGCIIQYPGKDREHSNAAVCFSKLRGRDSQKP